MNFRQFLTQEINNAVNFGRLRNNIRRGCVVVFSAGNSIPYQDVLYPANLPGVIAVGAIDKCGTVWNYSCRGSALEVVAPSGNAGFRAGDVYTLARMGSYGYESGNYTWNFGGTSAAAPQVAGVAALILSANPNFTPQQVVNRIESTALKVGGYLSYSPSNHNGTWNSQMGHGLVDAYAALTGTPSIIPNTPSISYELIPWPSGKQMILSLSVDNPQWGVAYQWEIDGSIIPNQSNPHISFLSGYLNSNTQTRSISVTLRCRAVHNGRTSAWSSSITQFVASLDPISI